MSGYLELMCVCAIINTRASSRRSLVTSPPLPSGYRPTAATWLVASGYDRPAYWLVGEVDCKASDLLRSSTGTCAHVPDTPQTGGYIDIFVDQHCNVGVLFVIFGQVPESPLDSSTGP